MRVLSIMARHGVEKYPDAVPELRAFQRSRLPGWSCDLLVVDNAGVGPGTEPDAPETIAGSGRHREFSAWDEGLAHVGARLREYDLVHLVTSAFQTLYTRYIDRCDERTLRVVPGRGMAVGHIDYYNEPVVLRSVRSQYWLRSSFLFLPPAELLTLGSLVSIPEGSDLFSGDPARPFRPDAPVCENYRRYMYDWLTGAGTGQGTTWHSRFELTTATLPEFQAKVLAILNEHSLTIRLRRQGCAPVDATWLATAVARQEHGAEGPLPSWRDQLAARDNDAVRPPRVG